MSIPNPPKDKVTCTKCGKVMSYTESLVHVCLYKPEMYESIPDPINTPPGYTRGKIEVRDFITDQKLDFNTGNVIKYLCRAGFKPGVPKIDDLKKAQNYLNYLIEMEEKENDPTQ